MAFACYLIKQDIQAFASKLGSRLIITAVVFK